MCELFRLKRCNNGPPGEFDIISKDLSKVGQFTNSWNTSFPNYVGIDKLYGISFPVDMATEEKAILFGVLFTLVSTFHKFLISFQQKLTNLKNTLSTFWLFQYFQRLHEGGVGDNRRKKFWAYGICIFIGVFLVIGVLTLILWGILKE